ncbi:MAG: protein translocase subunit SecF [Candidatus Levybacteria bacterium]|nr:protein translocase subunit SecF [Candidatus Levybacteria bacterium]
MSNFKFPISNKDISEVFGSEKITVHKLEKISDNTFRVQTDTIEQGGKNEVIRELEKRGKITEKSFETVGPTIGQETQANAIKAVIVASIAITAYIAFAFREVSNPVSSWKYGVSAIVALLHDVLIVVGLFSILGKILNVEVDSLFITALLTIMGFSVHDTIVVFDRIRENLRKNFNLKFEEVVNNSLLETLNRSLNTSLTVVIVLLALLLFGGETTRWFIVALLVGIVSGTYSSIFNASQLLVVWNEWDKKKHKDLKLKT